MNGIQDILNVDVSNVHRTVQKYAENHENSNDYIANLKDNFKDVQRQKSAQSAIEGSGELLSNHEKNIQLETIEKEFEGLNIKNEFITDQVQIIADRNELSNDQINTIKAEINKIQTEMEIMHDRKINKELENVAYFKAIVDKMAEIHSHIDQFTEIVNGLKLTLENACENKETITEILEASEYLRAHCFMRVTEVQRNFTEQINKHASEIDQLKTSADDKTKEVDMLRERANEQKLSIESNEKSMKYITDKISNFFSYIKQLQDENDQSSAPNEKQKDFLLLLAEQLDEMSELLELKKKEHVIQNLDDQKNLFFV